MDSNFQTPPLPIEKPVIKLPCPFSAQGMLQPKNLQPPPMYGPRGSTIPPKFLARPVRPHHHQKFDNRNNFTRPPRTQHTTRYRNPSNANFRHNRPPSNNRRFDAPATQQNSNFWCETCDRGFYTEAHLQQHISEHQNCGIDGCQFTGHELMIAKHIELQHSTGLYDKIKNLQTPEDIEKWREERRRRYPTKQNIEQRQQAQTERKKRGELLNESKSRFGNPRDRNRNTTTTAAGRNDKKCGKQKSNNNKNRRKRNARETITTTVAKNDVTATAAAVENDECVGMFRGTSLMENYKTTYNKTQSKDVNALASLVGMYGSDNSSSSDESDDGDDDNGTKDDLIISEHFANRKESVDEIKSDVDEVPENVILEKTPKCVEETVSECQIHDDAEINDENQGEAPDEQPVERNTTTEVVSSISPANENNSSSTRKRKRNRKAALIVEKRNTVTLLDLEKRYRNQNTMLEKLLQKDIRHERNVLLQCVRYVVQNNFFGIGNENNLPSAIEEITDGGGDDKELNSDLL